MALLRSLWVSLGLRTEAFEAGIKRSGASMHELAVKTTASSMAFLAFTRSAVRLGGTAMVINFMGRMAEAAADAHEQFRKSQKALEDYVAAIWKAIPYYNSLYEAGGRLYGEFSGDNEKQEKKKELAKFFQGYNAYVEKLNRTQKLLSLPEEERPKQEAYFKYLDALRKAGEYQEELNRLDRKPRINAEQIELTQHLSNLEELRKKEGQAAKDRSDFLEDIIQKSALEKMVLEGTLTARESEFLLLIRETSAIKASAEQRQELIDKLRETGRAYAELDAIEARREADQKAIDAAQKAHGKREDERRDLMERLRNLKESLLTPAERVWEEFKKRQGLLEQGISKRMMPHEEYFELQRRSLQRYKADLQAIYGNIQIRQGIEISPYVSITGLQKGGIENEPIIKQLEAQLAEQKKQTEYQRRIVERGGLN